MSAALAKLPAGADSTPDAAVDTASLPRAPDVVPVALFMTVRAALLVRFVHLFAPYLSARGVYADGASCDPAWRTHLCDVLAIVDRDMPSDLQDALAALLELASDSAQERLIALARDTQMGLFVVDAETTPADLAFGLYLDERARFRALHARVRTARVKRFVEFFASAPLTIATPISPLRVAELTEAVRNWFLARGRTGYRDATPIVDGDTITFLIVHGSKPKDIGTIENDGRHARLRFVPDKKDSLVYHQRTGRLAVHALGGLEQDFYRRSFGRIFGGDTERFPAKAIYTGAPLVERGVAALDPHGVRGLREVALRDVSIAPRRGISSRYHGNGSEMRAFLEEPIWALMRPSGVVTAFKLELVLQGCPRAVSVEVKGTQTLNFDRHFDEIVREYLLAAGFISFTGEGAANASARDDAAQ